MAAKPVVAAVSPFFGGRALKGPAATISADLHRAPGTAGLLEAYGDLLSHLVVDREDAADVARFEASGVAIHAEPTRIIEPASGISFAARLIEILESSFEPAPLG